MMNEPISIRPGEPCSINTNGTINQGHVVHVFINEIAINVNGQRYIFNRRYARRTRLQRLLIEVL